MFSVSVYGDSGDNKIIDLITYSLHKFIYRFFLENSNTIDPFHLLFRYFFLVCRYKAQTSPVSSLGWIAVLNRLSVLSVLDHNQPASEQTHQMV